MPITPKVWLGPTQANTTDAGPGGNLQSEPQIVVLGESAYPFLAGQFQIWWLDDSMADPGYVNDVDNRSLAFDPSGAAVEDEDEVVTKYNGTGLQLDNFALSFHPESDADWLYYWSRSQDSGNDVQGVWRGYGRQSGILADFIYTGQTAVGGVNIAAGAGLGYFSSYLYDAGSTMTRVFSWIDENGDPVWESTQSWGDDFDPTHVLNQGDAAYLGGGRYVIVDRRDIVSDATIGVTIAEFDQGNPSLSSQFLGQQNGLVDTNPEVAVLADGDFVVVWERGGADVLAQLFDNDGDPKGAAFSVAASGDSENEPTVTALHDGGFIVFWDNDTDGGLEGQRFDKNGNQVGNQVFVAGAPTELTAETLPDGRVVLAWRDGDDIDYMIWDVRDGVPSPTPGDDAIAGDFKDDTINGGIGHDAIYGWIGDDVLLGGSGEDGLYGGGGDDDLNGGGFGDDLFGEGGNDVIVGGLGDDLIDGSLGFDTLTGSGGDDVIIGGGSADSLTGNNGNDDLDGGAGGDTIDGNAGLDTINGGPGNDVINAGGGKDTVIGFTGNDVIDGGKGGDDISGNAGSDTIDGGYGNDVISGDGGHDVILGNGGSDVISGGNGNDEIRGGLGGDVITGDRGDDVIYGQGGSDTIDGGEGQDLMFGGDMSDTFVFTSIADSGNGPLARDRIFDFSRAEGDVIDLSGIDANANAGGDQAFEVVGSFFGIAGQMVISDLGGGDKLVELDVDGDASADMAFEVAGQADLGAGDFIL